MSTASRTGLHECRLGALNSDCFSKWVLHFVAIVSDLTADGRKVFLTYAGHSSHMSVRVLDLFEKMGLWFMRYRRIRRVRRSRAMFSLR